jgi:8-oxo-dGTP diphosphatase
MKHIHVACAIIEKNGKVLATQRSAEMVLPLKWEFPGGKIDAGESAEACLKRELIEELSICVNVNQELPSYKHNYSIFTVTLYPFVCSILAGEITLHEHAACCWLAPEELCLLDWAAADVPVLNSYIAKLSAGPL